MTYSKNDSKSQAEPTAPEKILFTWSGGKDSAFALHQLRKDSRFEITSLLTTLTEGYDRVSIHGVRRELLEAQADSIGMDLQKVYISQKSSNEDYEQNMRNALQGYKDKGVHCVAFGDIFLEDLRQYRQSKLDEVQMQAVFPIWKKDTTELSRQFIEDGFKAIVTCVDTDCLSGEFAGRIYDESFLNELPDDVDPCGENGEFHSFVYDGPIFSVPINFKPGEKVLREKRFCFCDLVMV